VAQRFSAAKSSLFSIAALAAEGAFGRRKEFFSSLLELPRRPSLPPVHAVEIFARVAAKPFLTSALPIWLLLH